MEENTPLITQEKPYCFIIGMSVIGVLTIALAFAIYSIRKSNKILANISEEKNEVLSENKKLKNAFSNTKKRLRKKTQRKPEPESEPESEDNFFNELNEEE